MRTSKTEFALILGLIAVTVFVLVSSWVAPDPLALLRERYDLLGILIVSAVAQWRGVRAGIVAAVASFIVIWTIGEPSGRLLSLTAPTDLYVDGAVFFVVAMLTGVQTGRLHQREQAAERNQRRWTLLSELSAQFVSDAPRVEFAGFLRHFADLLGTSSAYLFTPDADGQLTSGDGSALSTIAAVPGARILVDSAARSSSDAAAAAADTAGSAAVGGSAGLAVPLLAPTGFLGVLYATPRTDGVEFGEGDLLFAEVAAKTVAAYLERERLSQQVAESVAQAASDHLRASLLSSVSHELKTPLAAATARVTDLRDRHSQGDSDLTAELDAVQANLRRINERIGDLLVMSRLEASMWQPVLDWNDPRDVFASVLSLTTEPSRERLRCELPGDMPMLRFDLVQLSRAVYHLVENALAYSPPGSPVTIGGSFDDGFVRLWVEDSGPGMPDSEKTIVFGKFCRGSAASSAPHGTGLGLTIAQDIVRYHGGTVTIEDVQPHGARVIIELEREVEA